MAGDEPEVTDEDGHLAANSSEEETGDGVAPAALPPVGQNDGAAAADEHDSPNANNAEQAAELARLRRDLRRARWRILFLQVPWWIVWRMFAGRRLAKALAGVRQDIELVTDPKSPPQTLAEWLDTIGTVSKRSPKRALDVVEAAILRSMRRETVMIVLSAGPVLVLLGQLLVMYQQSVIMGRTEDERALRDAEVMLDTLATADEMDVLSAERFVDRVQDLPEEHQSRLVNQLGLLHHPVMPSLLMSWDEDLEWRRGTRVVPDADTYASSGDARQYGQALIAFVLQALRHRGVLPEDHVLSILSGEVQLVRIDVPYAALLRFNQVGLTVHLRDCKTWEGPFMGQPQLDQTTERANLLPNVDARAAGVLRIEALRERPVFGPLDGGQAVSDSGLRDAGVAP